MNKFKQNKTVKEKKLWIVTPSMRFNLLEPGIRTTFKIIGRRNLKKMRKSIYKKSRKLWAVSGRLAKKPRKRAYFFKKKGWPRDKVNLAKLFYSIKHVEVKRVLQQFRVSKKARTKVILRYKRRLNLFKWQGAYMWAMLGAMGKGSKFWNRYTLVHKHMAAIKKQEAYENRRFGHKNVLRKVTLHTIGATRYLKRKTKRFFFKAKVAVKGVRLSATSKRQKFLLWKRAVLSQTWGLRYLPLKFKFNNKSVQQGKFSAGIMGGKKWKKRIWFRYRLDQLAYKSQTKGLSILQLELLQKQVQARLQNLKIFDANRAIILKTELAGLSKKLKKLKAPTPWWMKKKKGFKKGSTKRNKAYTKGRSNFTVMKKSLTSGRLLRKWSKRRKVKRLVYFGQQRFEWKNQRKLVWIPWYKVTSRRFLAYNVSGAWGGADVGVLAHRFTRVKIRGRNKRRTGLYFFAHARKLNLNKVTRANTVESLKTLLASHQPRIMEFQTGAQDLVVKNPVLFRIKKVSRAFGFNKFLKVNKVAVRVINNVSLDLYSQYITNLQAGVVAISSISDQRGSTNVRAARMLRKYLKLLKQYFNEVHDSKVAKKVPASSAMYWICEYLRLTSSIKRRVSLWNRFNHVAFHFRPKAKEDEKRGRKKKILFKAKILFDRLFNWLYAQPNARYALAAPIQNGIVRDYIVRNQFIFKKGFKVKLLG